MTVADSARHERAMHANFQCEAEGSHHSDCPGKATPENEWCFILHHIIRRQDTFAEHYDTRDDVEHLRLIWNGPNGRLGTGGCHQRIHDNVRRSRDLGLLIPRPDLTGVLA